MIPDFFIFRACEIQGTTTVFYAVKIIKDHGPWFKGEVFYSLTFSNGTITTR